MKSAISALLLLATLTSVGRAETTVCISNNTRNCSFVGPPVLNHYEEYYSHSHTPQEVAADVCRKQAKPLESMKVLRDETGNSDRKLLIEVRCVGEDDDYNVCVSQHVEDCLAEWPTHKWVFISCPEHHVSEDQIAQMACDSQAQLLKRQYSGHRSPVKKISDQSMGMCGRAILKVYCIKQ